MSPEGIPERADYSRTSEMSRRTTERLAGATAVPGPPAASPFRVLPGIRHFPPAEAPQRFAPHLLAALDGGEAAALTTGRTTL